MKTINAKYRTHCQTCYFTIFKNERMGYDGKAYHLDCITALKDEFPRSMDKTKERIYGKVNRTKWAEHLKSSGYKAIEVKASNNYKHRANRGVRLWAG